MGEREQSVVRSAGKEGNVSRLKKAVNVQPRCTILSSRCRDERRETLRPTGQ